MFPATVRYNSVCGYSSFREVTVTKTETETTFCRPNKSGLSNQHITLAIALLRKQILTITNSFSKMVPNIQIESSATPLLTVHEVEKVQRQRVATIGDKIVETLS